MKKIIVFAIIAIVFTSCSKEFEERTITYRFERGPTHGFYSYLYQDSLYTDSFNVSTIPMKVWDKTLKGNQGDPLYFYVRYSADQGHQWAMMSFKAMILADGKALKELSLVDQRDSVIVSGRKYYFFRLYGTVPF